MSEQAKQIGDGGPAFPVDFVPGMTLRDYFAAQAIVGYAANARVMDRATDDWQGNGGARPTCIAEFLAGLAYEVADAMLAERAVVQAEFTVKPPHHGSRPIEWSKLTARAANTLRRMGCKTVEDVAAVKLDDLIGMRAAGERTRREIALMLHRYGLEITGLLPDGRFVSGMRHLKAGTNP